MARYSYSKISTYLKCPRKFKHSYIDQLPRKEAGPAASRGTEIHSAMENFLLGKTTELPAPVRFYDDFLTQLKDAGAIPEIGFAVNRQWEITEPDAEDIFMIGYIDALLPHEDELVIYDWKTGKIYDEHYDQRELYGIVSMILYPKYDRIRVENVYTDLQQIEHNVFFREELEAARSKWMERVERIEADEVFVPNPQFACRWCDFSSANGGPCPF